MLCLLFRNNNRHGDSVDADVCSILRSQGTVWIDPLHLVSAGQGLKSNHYPGRDVRALEEGVGEPDHPLGHAGLLTLACFIPSSSNGLTFPYAHHRIFKIQIRPRSPQVRTNHRTPLPDSSGFQQRPPSPAAAPACTCKHAHATRSAMTCFQVRREHARK